MTQMIPTIRRVLLPALFIAGSGLAMGINDDNGCAPTGGGGGVDECSFASECGGVPPVDCAGAWQCEDGGCAWSCDDQPPTGCYSDTDCTGAQTCNAAEVCLLPPGCNGNPDGCPAVCYGFCEDDDTPPPPPEVCWTDSDCGPQEQCNTWDYCLGPDGQGDTPSGAQDFSDEAIYVCGGKCEPKAPPTTCDVDDDCGPGFYCGCGDPATGSASGAAEYDPDPNGVACLSMCLPVDPPDTCGEVSCGLGQHCEEICVDTPCDCADGGSGGEPGSDGARMPCECDNYCEPICVDDQVPQQCASDEDCRSEEYCGCGDGPWASPNAIMCFMQCLPKDPPPPVEDCQKDSQCGDGGRCVIDYCGPGYFGGDQDEDGDGQSDYFRPCDPDPATGDCVEQCYGHCEEGPGEFECSSDAPCGEGECAYQYCEAVMCEPTQDCDWREVCYGFCEDIQPPEWECTSDDQCDSGRCEFVLCEGSSSDPFCGEGEDCGMPGQCYGFCADDHEPQQCADDGSCPDGFYCGCADWGFGGGFEGSDPSGIPCMPMCQPEEEPGECMQDHDCPPEHACVAGPWGNSCEPTQGGECQSDDQCPGGSSCELSECMTWCPDCGADGQCPPCQTECWGVCKDGGEPEQCNNDLDCGAHETCTCTADPSCPFCDVCFFQCVADPDGTEPCYEDSHCSDGEVCNLSMCGGSGGGGGCPPGADCFAPSDCLGFCEAPTEPEPTECQATGCSGEICAAQPTDSICVELPHYICYEMAECGQTADGACGWKPSPAFVACMEYFDAAP